MSQVHLPELESMMPDFPGDRFVAAREQLGLSVEQVASELRLLPEQVEALEAGDFARLNSVVFTRGYIRAYAKLLKLDGDELVRQYDRCLGGKNASTPIRTVTRVRPSASSAPVTFGSLILLVVAIVGATVWWWQTQYGHEVTADAQPEPTVAVDTADGETLVFNAPDTDAPLAPLLPKKTVNVDDEPLVFAPAEDSSSEVSTIEAVSADPQPQAAEVDEPAADGLAANAEGESDGAQAAAETAEAAGASAVVHGQGLYLSFSDDCWVTIKDASGKTLFNNLRKAGQDLELPQSGPMNVLLGRVSAVSEITFDGSVVDLAPFSNKNVARLRLPVAR